MAIYYTVIEQQNARNPEETIYYPRAVANGEVDLDVLTEDLEMMSTLSGADIHGVIHGLIDRIAHYISEGKIVRLDGLASLRVSLNSTKEESKEDVDETSVKKVRLVINPEKRIRRTLDRLELRKKKA